MNMVTSHHAIFRIAALLSIVPLVIADVSRFPWIDLDRSKDIAEAFGNGSSSFDVTDNWKICMSHVLNIPYRANVTNYAPVISLALEILQTLGGGSVRLSSGTFPVASSIEMPSHTCIVGGGAARTILKLVDFAPSFYPAKGIIRSTKGERVSLQGFTIDGNKMSQSMNPLNLQGRNGVHFERVNYVWVRNVKAYNNSANGFDFHGAENQWSYHLAVEGTSAEGNGEDGVKIYQVFYASMFNCLAHKNGRHGLSITAGSMHTLIKRNKITGNGEGHRGCGIFINSEKKLSTRAIRLVDNHIHNSTLAGLCLHDVSQIAVKKANISSTNSWTSFCYDIRNTATFTISNDTTCVVRSGVSYNPRNVSALAAEAAVEIASANGTAGPQLFARLRPSPQPASAGCGAGIGDRDICCPLICGECGGVGCGQKLPDGQCCYDQIKSTSSNCAVSPPPCVLEM